MVAGAIRMETLNTAAVFKDIEDRLSAGISHNMEGRNVISVLIDVKAYREFERNKHVGTFFDDGERPPGFRVTATHCNLLVLVFRNVDKTRDAFNFGEMPQINTSLACWDSSKMTPLASPAKVAALVVASSAEPSTRTVGMTTFAPGGPSGAGGSSGVSGLGGGLGSGGSVLSGGAAGPAVASEFRLTSFHCSFCICFPS